MLQSGTLAAEDMRWLCGLGTVIIGSNSQGNTAGTVTKFMCPNSPKALAPAFKQLVVRYFAVRCSYHVNCSKILAVRKR
jgi:hypothetical protein